MLFRQKAVVLKYYLGFHNYIKLPQFKASSISGIKDQITIYVNSILSTKIIDVL